MSTTYEFYVGRKTKEGKTEAIGPYARREDGYHLIPIFERKLFRALTRLCPVPIRFEEISGGAKGYYNDAEKVIAIQQGMSQTQTIKTLVHEMMHQKLHAKEAQDPDHPTDRRTKEVEAESAAFCVASAYGIDTSEYSFGYVAGWSSGKETKELKASLERIQTAADEMITGIDQLIEKQNRREKQQDRER